MSECYLTASEQFFRYIMAGTNKLRVASTQVHPWFSDGVRVTHPVVFFVCFSCLCTVPNLASVSALFIHDCLWVSLYCGQCLCFVHWFSLYCGQCLLYSFMIAFGFLCTVASVSALFIGFLCTVASVCFIHS